eukprot:GHVN01017163.1.p1 GENE.GHVN01017163.1~~GHVN01017163.1.p1  ORF type:complete len:706 (+),score=103.27 GHVN01017163.1:92-2209(+)
MHPSTWCDLSLIMPIDNFSLSQGNHYLDQCTKLLNSPINHQHTEFNTAHLLRTESDEFLSDSVLLAGGCSGSRELRWIEVGISVLSVDSFVGLAVKQLRKILANVCMLPDELCNELNSLTQMAVECVMALAISIHRLSNVLEWASCVEGGRDERAQESKRGNGFDEADEGNGDDRDDKQGAICDGRRKTVLTCEDLEMGIRHRLIDLRHCVSMVDNISQWILHLHHQHSGGKIMKYDPSVGTGKGVDETELWFRLLTDVLGVNSEGVEDRGSGISTIISMFPDGGTSAFWLSLVSPTLTNLGPHQLDASASVHTRDEHHSDVHIRKCVKGVSRHVFDVRLVSELKQCGRTHKFVGVLVGTIHVWLDLIDQEFRTDTQSTTTTDTGMVNYFHIYLLFGRLGVVNGCLFWYYLTNHLTQLNPIDGKEGVSEVRVHLQSEGRTTNFRSLAIEADELYRGVFFSHVLACLSPVRSYREVVRAILSLPCLGACGLITHTIGHCHNGSRQFEQYCIPVRGGQGKQDHGHNKNYVDIGILTDDRITAVDYLKNLREGIFLWGPGNVGGKMGERVDDDDSQGSLRRFVEALKYRFVKIKKNNPFTYVDDSGTLNVPVHRPLRDAHFIVDQILLHSLTVQAALCDLLTNVSRSHSLEASLRTSLEEGKRRIGRVLNQVSLVAHLIYVTHASCVTNALASVTFLKLLKLIKPLTC